MKFYIYVIQNRINNKIYVGKTNNPQTRWSHHTTYAKGGKVKYPNQFQYLHASISKHGINKFSFQIIEEFDNEIDCFEAEQFWIQFFRSWNNNYGYNLTHGGEGSSGRIVSEATKDKIRVKATGRLHTTETKEKISRSSKLQNPSEETRKKRSISLTGKKRTEEQTAANSLRQRGDLSPSASLTNAQASEIRELVKTYTVKKVASMYGVSKSTISHIKNNRTYKDKI